jgi:hypothetical protein
MSLKEGNLSIGKIIIDKNTTLNDIQEFVAQYQNISIRKKNDGRANVRFTEAVPIGNKRFVTRISISASKISRIELKISDSSINEWDYKELMRLHREWLEEQIGYPESTLLDNEYSWGTINQWYDPRVRDAGITILYQ